LHFITEKCNKSVTRSKIYVVKPV